MKKTALIATLMVCSAIVAPAQERSITTKPRDMIIEPVKPQPNEIITEKSRYSGAVVQAVKSENPVQIFSPVAPAEYGRAEQNVTRDPASGKVDGIRLFSFSPRPRPKRAPVVIVKEIEPTPAPAKAAATTPPVAATTPAPEAKPAPKAKQK